MYVQPLQYCSSDAAVYAQPLQYCSSAAAVYAQPLQYCSSAAVCMHTAQPLHYCRGTDKTYELIQFSYQPVSPYIETPWSWADTRPAEPGILTKVWNPYLSKEVQIQHFDFRIVLSDDHVTCRLNF